MICLYHLLSFIDFFSFIDFYLFFVYTFLYRGEDYDKRRQIKFNDKDIYQSINEVNEMLGENAIDVNETAFAPDKVLKRADEQLKWQKTFKRRKNKLHRLINKLRIWDYSFTERIILELVKLNCEYYGNPDIIEFATDNGKLKSYQKNLFRIIPIFPLYEQVAECDCGKLNPRKLSYEFREYCPNHQLKDSRHTFTTRARECGIDNERVAVWTGHSLGNITSSVNTHFSIGFQQEQAKKLIYN